MVELFAPVSHRAFIKMVTGLQMAATARAVDTKWAMASTRRGSAMLLHS